MNEMMIPITPTRRPSPRRATRRRGGAADPRGFTLIEALIASSILLGIVTAVTAAVVAGQQQAFEAQQRIAAALAADALMARLAALPYTDLPKWNGHHEPAGDMIDERGDAMPPAFDGVGREATIINTFRSFNPPDVNIRGVTIRVRAFDSVGNTLVTLERFVPEPQA